MINAILLEFEQHEKKMTSKKNDDEWEFDRIKCEKDNVSQRARTAGNMPVSMKLCI